MNENLYNILIIDDHPIVTDGLETLLDTHIQAHYTKTNDLNTLKQVLTGTDFNLCITDLEFPGTDGFNLIRMIHEHLPQCPILVYTMHEEPWIATKLYESDIRDFISGAVSKHADLDEIPIAVNAIRNGQEYFSQAFSLLHDKRSITENRSPYRTLSEREKEVLTYLMQGLSTREIARRMYLSINTIQTYRKRLLEKMNAKNVAELVSKCKGLF